MGEISQFMVAGLMVAVVVLLSTAFYTQSSDKLNVTYNSTQMQTLRNLSYNYTSSMQTNASSLNNTITADNPNSITSSGTLSFGVSTSMLNAVFKAGSLLLDAPSFLITFINGIFGTSMPVFIPQYVFDAFAFILIITVLFVLINWLRGVFTQV